MELKFKIEKERQLISLNSDARRSSIIEHDNTEDVEKYASENNLHLWMPYEGIGNEYKYCVIMIENTEHSISIHTKEKWRKKTELISY